MAEATKNGNGTAVVEQKSMLLLDLGAKSRKKLSRTRKGRGKLMSRINGAIEDLRAEGEIGEDSQVVVVVVKQQARKRGWW